MASDGVSGAGNNGNAGKSDSKSSDDKTSKGGGSSKNGSDKGSFDNALSGASKNDKSSSSDAANAKSSNKTAATDKSTAHANEFSGLGSSGGSPTGNDSLNSHRGYGPDNSVAGGIDQDANAGLAARTEAPTGFDRPAALDIAGYGAAGASGATAFTAQHANVKGIKSAASVLSQHPTGNLPAHPDFPGSNRDYAKALTGEKTAKAALDNLPHYKGGVVRSTLESAADTAAKYGRTATGVGVVFDPVVTGVAAAVSTEGTWTEKATAAVIEGAKRADNVAVSGLAGFSAASATMGITAGWGTLAAPTVGATAGIAAGEVYAKTPADPAFNGLVESARPAVQAGFDAVDGFIDAHAEAAETISDLVGEGWDRLKSALSDDDDLPVTLAP